MKFSLKNLFLFILFLWLYCLVPSLSQAQTNNQDPKISISAVNEPISQVLERLSRNTGITFSYNPDHIDASRLVSLNLKEIPLSDALASLLPPDKFGFRFSGNQVVIFRKAVSVQNESPGKEPLPETGVIKPPKVLPDTVFITQTLTIRDTLALTDTVIKFDTVYIMRTVARDNPITGKDIFSNQTNLSEEQTKELKFEAGFSLTWLASKPVFDAPPDYSTKLDEYNNSYSGSLFSGTAGVDLRMSYARISLNTGISYTNFNGKLDYGYEVSTGGYYRKDTLDAYYTLINSDTTWYYVLDSAYMPVDLEAFRYKTNFSLRYFEFPLSLQYNHPFGKMLIYGQAGLIGGINAGSEGLLILPDKDGVVGMTEVKFKPVVFSYMFGAGILIPVTGKITFDAGFMYRQHFNSVLSDFPIEYRTRAFGLKAGLVYKL
jgi:opacity protein-like surface antigen